MKPRLILIYAFIGLFIGNILFLGLIRPVIGYWRLPNKDDWHDLWMTSVAMALSFFVYLMALSKA